jgi:hypothetical protein
LTFATAIAFKLSGNDVMRAERALRVVGKRRTYGGSG